MALVLLGLVLVGLAAIGLLDALYFLLARPPIMDTPQARVFGLSNAAYGLAWYLLVAVAGAWVLTQGALPVCWGLLLVSAGTVLLAVYLIHQMIVELETLCPLCLVGHGVNLGILVALVLAC